MQNVKLLKSLLWSAVGLACASGCSLPLPKGLTGDASVLNTVCVYHIIWSANSFCHRFGTRRFATRDNSRNNFIVALLTLGDGWHHNHHFCPYSARHGFRWWEIDINYAILRLLAFLGIVWDVKVPPRAPRKFAE